MPHRVLKAYVSTNIPVAIIRVNLMFLLMEFRTTWFPKKKFFMASSH
jgi:hypothetical protein